MTDEESTTEPSATSLEDIPEVDFEGAVRPNRYANLRGDFRHTVALDAALFEHFGSQEKVVEALALLVEVAKRTAA